MDKIKTIFKRDLKTRKVINEYDVPLEYLQICDAVEKVDGTNIRLTVRKGEVVRIEARRNPSKSQKKKGIIQPWYRDVDEINDKHIISAVEIYQIDKLLRDGEFIAEAYGDKIQGNPLGLQCRSVFLFSIPMERYYKTFDNVPLEFEKLKEFLKKQESFITGEPIEGIVFWYDNKPIGKIKVKDFDYNE